MSEKIYIQDNDKIREATQKEIAQLQKDQAEWAEQQRLLESELQAKEELKQSAIAKLAAIGLTEEEAKIIIGIG
jgi:transposase